MALVVPVIYGGINIGGKKPKDKIPCDCFKCIHGETPPKGTYIKKHGTTETTLVQTGNSVFCMYKGKDMHIDMIADDMYCNKFESREEK